jgi:hypothetical protein
MPVEYRKWITRDMLRAERDKLFVFGDNMAEVGLGGQAASMRGEPNAVGIATKWTPDMLDSAFFTDADHNFWLKVSGERFDRLMAHHQQGGVVVWPADDIGTGLARLPGSSPMIFQAIQSFKKRLEGNK